MDSTSTLTPRQRAALEALAAGPCRSSRSTDPQARTVASGVVKPLERAGLAIDVAGHRVIATERGRDAAEHHLRHQHAPTTQPGRILAQVADDWGVEVSDILTGAAVSARHDAPHRIAAANPDMSGRKVAQLVGLGSVTHILAADPPSPPEDAPPRPVDIGQCTIEVCDRPHRSSGLRLCSGHIARWRRGGDLATPLRAVNQTGPVLDLDVHDRSGYRDGCRCSDCRRDAVLAVARNRLRPQSRPLSAGLAALDRLIDAGMSIPAIADAAGIGSACLYTWRRATVASCLQSTIDKLNAVQPPPATCQDCGADAWGPGGRWCKPCLDARTLPTTPGELDDARRRQQARRRRRRYRREAA